MSRKRIMKLWPLVVLILVALLVGNAAPSPVFGGEGGGQGQLDERQVRARALFEIEGVVYTDAAEQTGLLEVGVVNKGLARAVEERLKKLGIPLSSVEIVETKPIVFAATLQDYVRPLEGGLQIAFVDGGLAYLCTLGFNAVRDGVNGFVVNSHCTTDQFKLDGTNHYQPWLSPSSNLIGNEIADPPSFRCARGKKCRYSDAAYDQRASGVQATLGSIARPSALGSLTIAGSFNVVGEAAGNAAVGATLNKVGRTTGWTQGPVTNSCVDTGVSGTNILLLCQDFVGANVGGGDSGSPVFEITPGTNNVTLNGILWGGASDGSFFVFSPIANVERELGSLTTFGDGNTTPVASDDSATTPEDTAVTINVLANDTDADGDALTVTNLTQPANGTATLNTDNTVTYTPNADFNGDDSFTYMANDGTSDSNIATVSITVNAVNDPPVANDDTASTTKDTPVTIDVLANDSDVDGNPLSVTSATSPSNGSVIVNDDNTITYTPKAEFTGTDSFTYDISDGKGGTDSATVTVTVSEGADTMHVGDLEGSKDLKGTSGRWEVFVTVTIHDENCNPVANATVSGKWSSATSGTVSGTTGSDDTVTFSTGNMSGGTEVTFTVTGVTHDILTYDATANHDPDGDSDGTIITVSK